MKSYFTHIYWSFILEAFILCVLEYVKYPMNMHAMQMEHTHFLSKDPGTLYVYVYSVMYCHYGLHCGHSRMREHLTESKETIEISE